MQVKPVALAATSVSSLQLALQTVVHDEGLCSPVCVSESKGDYFAFILDGDMPGKKEVVVKILRDTGLLHSFCDSILPFSPDTNTEDFILIWSMGMTIIPVLLHKLSLVCALVTREIAV